GRARQRPLPQPQHQRGPDGRAGRGQGLPRRVLRQPVHAGLRRGLDGGGRPGALRARAPRLRRRRARPRRAPPGVLGPAGPDQALPGRGRAVPRGEPLMVTGIDHLVVAVRDLEAATRAYRELGFTVVEGGRHPVGTYNSLIAFDDRAYLELIGFYRDNPEHRWWAPLQRGGGLVDFCLETDDLEADTRAFRAAGVDIADPTGQSPGRPR